MNTEAVGVFETSVRSSSTRHRHPTAGHQPIS